MKKDSRKVAIIGLGKVGITASYALLLKGVADELVLVSRSLDKVQGEQLDLEHSLPFLETAKITASTDYAAISDADVVVITAGVAQKPGETRLDLTQENKQIIKELAAQIRPHVQNSVVVMVSNPVDVLTYLTAQELQLPKGRVLGTGTLLDTARFRFHLSQLLNVHSRSVHAYILGEHGESAFPALAHATVGGQLLTDFPYYTHVQAMQAFDQTRESAAKIIQAKGATYYAIGVVIAQLVKTILQDSRSVLPVSTPINDYYGQGNLAISVPCVIGRNGVEQVLKIQLSDEEQARFVQSCEIVKKYL